MDNQRGQNMTSKIIIRKDDILAKIGLIDALFWIDCGVLIKRQDNGYDLNGDSLIRWWAKLLGVDTSEYDKYTKYLTHEICNNFHPTQEEKVGRRKAFNFNKTIYKMAHKKLQEALKKLLKNGISLYGIEYKNGRQQNTRHKQIPVDYVVAQHIDIRKEILSQGESIYCALQVSTDELFAKFPVDKVAFSKKTLLNSATGSIVFDSEDIKNGNLGGRPVFFGEEVKNLVKGYILNKGGLKWYDIYYDVRILDCIDFLKKEHNINMSKRTMSSMLNEIRKELQSSEN